MITEEVKAGWLKSIGELFIKNGLRSTSMDDIASALRISKKTLYQVFRNKEDVVDQVMSWTSNEKFAQRIYSDIEKENAVVVLLGIRDQIICSILEYNIPAVFHDIEKYHPDIHDKIQQNHENFFKNVIVHVIKCGIANGMFKDIKNIKEQVWIMGTCLMLMRNNNDLVIKNKKTIIQTIFENLIYSIGTEEGIKQYEIINKK